MTLSDVKIAISEGCIIWNIGQLDKETQKWLSREVKKGNIVRNFGLWPFIHSGLTKKTYYHINYDIKDGLAWEKKVKY